MPKPLSKTHVLQQHAVLCYVRKTIEELFSPDQKFVIGCSGGHDSLVLSAIFNLLIPDRIRILHINHQLQSNANDWEKTVERWAENAALSYRAIKVEVNQTGNLEANARQARYDAFFSEVKTSEVLVLAHNLTDQIETLFLKLARGAGIKGLGCMHVLSKQKDLTIWRPLLNFERDAYNDLASYLQLSPVNDPMNQDENYDRVWLRQEILPKIKARKPSFFQSASQSIRHLQNAESIIQKAFGLFDFSQTVIDIHALQPLPSEGKKQILYQWLQHHSNQYSQPNAKLISAIEAQIINGRLDNKALIRWGNQTIKRHGGLMYLLPNKLNDEEKDKAIEQSIPFTSFYQSPKKTVNFITYQLSLNEQDIKRPLILFFPLTSPALQHPFTLASAAVFTHSKIQRLTIYATFRKGGEKILINPKLGKQSLKKLFQQWKIPSWKRDQTIIIGLQYLGWHKTQYLLIPNQAPVVAFQAAFSLKIKLHQK